VTGDLRIWNRRNDMKAHLVIDVQKGLFATLTRYTARVF
jgi:hypothetical protein